MRRWKHLKSVRSPGTPRKSCAPLLAPFHVPSPLPLFTSLHLAALSLFVAPHFLRPYRSRMENPGKSEKNRVIANP